MTASSTHDKGEKLKLLVATQFGPASPGGGPSVVRQMLSEQPIGSLFWWSCVAGNDSSTELSVDHVHCAAIPSKLMPHFRLTRLKSWLLEQFWSRVAAVHLRRCIQRTAPDVVWAIPHNWAILPLSSALLTRAVGAHVTVQDYVDVHGQLERFGPSRCRRMASLADRLYAEANTRDATSHPMMDDLLKRTGAPGAQMLHAGVEEADLTLMRSSRCEAGAVIRIAYAGTILAAEEFALFVRALRAVREQMSDSITLELYGSHSYATASWFDARWMRERGNLGERELVDELRKCTWGFAPMKLDDDDPRYNRFSFPTKFITYLAAGLPIISMGHLESSVMKMATQYRVGVTSSSGAVESLIADMATWLADRTPWSSYGPEIIRCAEAEFRASSMRAKLWSCFERCAEATRVHREANIPR